MKTWLNRDGIYVSDKPEEYFISKDAHGNNVFIGDTCRHKGSKRTFKVEENNYFSDSYFILKSTLC